MKAISGRWLKAGAALVAVAGFLAEAGTATAQAAPATQTIDSRELIQRLQRLERDMRDLQAETFRKAPGDHTAPPAPAATPNPNPAPPPPPEPQASIPDLNPILRQMGELEEGLGRFTGQMEELGHQVDLPSQKTDRLQKQMDFQAEQARAATAPMPPAQSADAGSELASVNPDAPALRGAPPSTLGQRPAGTPTPAPVNRPTDAKRQCDDAMNL